LDSIIDSLSFEMTHYIAIYSDHDFTDDSLPASLADYGYRHRRLCSTHLSPPHMREVTF
jgi:hypothetical protein